MFLSASAVDEQQVCLHSIQSRSDVAHHRHEEEGYLEYGVLKEVEAIHDAFVHVGMVHVDEEGEYP